MSKDKEFYLFLRNDLKIKPDNVRLYELAFLHRSASIVLPDGSVANNERLEYLGDAIIDAVVADYLFRNFPNEREGFLTQMRSKIVNRTHLDSIASQMGLAKVLMANERKEVLKKRICGDALEAFVGAMYLDLGFAKTQEYLIDKVFQQYINLNELKQTETDCKSRIIEWGQKYRLQVRFASVAASVDTGFSVQVIIGNVPIATGSGQSKKEAEQKASQKALTFISNANANDFSTKELLQYLERSKKR